jgi:asparagine synthase (glutamine-hydrolysing)
MCGIAGWYRRGGRPVPQHVVKSQCDSIRHRGPDDSGLFVEGDVGFGMRRLSIVDVRHGHQPMTTPDGRFTLVFNGEIYNHAELRPDLEAAGYRFRTRCDTETALAAYATWGPEAWARLEGMFAIAVWDARTRELALARDPLGIKPLYLTEQGGGLAFASELKALLPLPGHRFDIDDHAVADYFSYGHIRAPRAIYGQVRTLPPGRHLVIGPAGAPTSRTYWRPRLASSPRLSEAEWVEGMQTMLQATVRRHMLSDGPVGAFLSGGVDSSAVTAAMARTGASGLKAFTIGYPGAAIDETEAAAATARHLGVEHIVRTVDLDEAAAVLPAVQSCYDEPFADMAAVPNWYLSQTAAEHVKVVLCGEGGDELFAGYKRHRNARRIERLRPLIRALRPLEGAVAGLPAGSSAQWNYLRQKAQRFVEFIQAPDGYPQFLQATRISSRQTHDAVYRGELFEEADAAETLGQLGPAALSAGALDQFLLADLTVNMPGAMLTRLDRATMAHSLEARVPFLSHRFVDWALTVPLGLKMRGGCGKYILRKAIADWLPPGAVARPKQGFQMPLRAWFRGGLGTFAREIWMDSGAAASGYLDIAVTERLFEEHRSGAADHSRFLYAVGMFGCWWEARRSDPVDARTAISV